MKMFGKKTIKPGTLFAAMGEIREDYIAQAAPAQRRRRLPRYWIVLAACLVLSIGIGLGCIMLLHSSGTAFA